jgi:hypothetical protein
MNQAEFHLKLVINLRRGAAAPSRYTLDSQLRDILGTVGIQVTYWSFAAAKGSQI